MQLRNLMLERWFDNPDAKDHHLSRQDASAATLAVAMSLPRWALVRGFVRFSGLVGKRHALGDRLFHDLAIPARYHDRPISPSAMAYLHRVASPGLIDEITNLAADVEKSREVPRAQGEEPVVTVEILTTVATFGPAVEVARLMIADIANRERRKKARLAAARRERQ